MNFLFAIDLLALCELRKTEMGEELKSLCA